MARLTRRFISKAKEKNLRRLISANGIIAAAFNCILFPLELSFATPGSLCLNTAAAAAANSFGWWHAFFWADLNLWVDLFRRHIFPDRTRKRARKKVNTSFIVIDFLFDLACVIPYDWLAHGSAACFSHGHLARLGLALRLFKLLREFTNFFCPALGMRRLLKMRLSRS